METKSADIHFRVEPSLKKAVSKIATKSGVRLADVLRYYLIKMKTLKRIPTIEEIYNKETLEALNESLDTNSQKRYKSFKDVRDELGI